MLQRNFRKLWTWYLFFYYLLHMKMKKMLLGAFLGMFAVAGVAFLPGMVNAQDAGMGGESDNPWANPDPSKSYVSEGNEQSLTGSAFLDTIKNAINWILGILATIALIVCLYGGFLMVTAAGDEKKYQKWLTVLKYAAVGLAIIGLSWLIVSIIFWFVGTLSGKNQTNSSGDQTVNNDVDWSSLRGNGDSSNANAQGGAQGGGTTTNCTTDADGNTVCS